MTDEDYWADTPIDIRFPNAPTERDECLFDSDEEDTLFDAYQMLRWAGVPKEKLWPMVMVIELTTVYDRNGLEHYYQEVIGGKSAFD